MTAPARRLAAPAPAAPDDEDTAPAQTAEQAQLDALCESWVRWRATRRLYGPTPRLGGTLGQLGQRMRSIRTGGPDAPCSQELAALQIAYTCQPDALDRRVFDMYYLHRVTPIKAAAAALGISRQHFYVVLADFRKRIHRAAAAIVAHEQEALAGLQSMRDAQKQELAALAD